MRRVLGFTLIELMIAMAVIAILTAIAYPSYQDHIRRSIRSQGQQYLMDLAQREEQFFLDRRVYTITKGAAGLNMPVATPSDTCAAANTLPCEIQGKYNNTVITLLPGPPQGFLIVMNAAPGSIMAADGTLFINNLQQRWRAVDDTHTTFGANDCRWEDTRCTPS